MAKQTGLGSALFMNEYNVSGDIGAISTIELSRVQLDVTGIDKSAFERVGGLKDGRIDFNSFWNTDAGQAHLVLSAITTSTANRIVSVFIGSTVGGAAASLTAKQVNYNVARGQDGSLGATIQTLSNGWGVEWGEMLTTGQQSFATGTVNGTAVDLGDTSTLFGAAAYLHVVTMPSGTATFTVADSANGTDFTAVTGMTFTNVTGPTSERVQGAVGATVRRYVRLQVTGTHGTSLAAVNFVRYLTSSAA